MPPIAAPRANGVRTDDTPKITPTRRSSRDRVAQPRSAYIVPRRMIPTAAMKNGTYSVDMIAPKASGYTVQAITSTKISQTWLASQTGPIAW